MNTKTRITLPREERNLMQQNIRNIDIGEITTAIIIALSQHTLLVRPKIYTEYYVYYQKNWKEELPGTSFMANSIIIF